MWFRSHLSSRPQYYAASSACDFAEMAADGGARALFPNTPAAESTTRLDARDERLAERVRIAQELHDTLFQGFLSASMQLSVAVDGLPPDSPVKPKLDRVGELIGQAIEEGRNALLNLRATTYRKLDLEQAFSRLPQELAVQGDIAFRVIVNGRARPLRPVLQEEVYRIGREALANAFRHSRATCIEIELQYAARQLRMWVRDDGCGVDPQVLGSGRQGHWGLSGMRERAERIGARLRLWSRAAAGTEVELSVPGALAFQTQPSMHPSRWFAGWYPRQLRAGLR
jgi:signal transduction histidine kinase